ncbi:class I SAM-dependent methyltransferase [Asanoa sp. WMMD1127]|uniref:O-methyltransferase n=1 Tax=Asanoa sp. WMMD1127 TaxID=3016107 RepID=UPI002415E6C2|nr:class I SAM-dependent methyltransferase [Asanoa sp. WMMD1127]MDG4826227.1 class I SAM-dependent methyltransferase [Asanoa sp. WMMD1127]
MEERIQEAMRLAERTGFAHSSVPAHGRLLQVLAGGVPGGGLVGETGTGCGVGLAWLAAGAPADARIVSVEIDPDRARAAQHLFAADPRITVLHGDWRDLAAYGPFDLLSLDGGGSGKTPDAGFAEPETWLRPGGTVVMDDFTPTTGWPPVVGGGTDHARMRWLNHPRLRATTLRLTPDMVALVGTRIR